MLEKDLNRIVGSGFRMLGHFAYKISDDAKDFKATVKKPCDLIISTDKTYFSEGKLIKGDCTSFKFDRLEEHQVSFLDRYKVDKSSGFLVHVGWYVPRKLKSFLFMEYEVIDYLKGLGVKSLKQKQVKRLMEKFELKIIKETWDVKNFEKMIIKLEDFKLLIDIEELVK